MHSFYEIFPDRVDWEVNVFSGGGVLIFERIEFLGWGRYRGGEVFFLKVKG